MAGIRSVFKSTLADDVTLAALLTGGIFDADDFGETGLSMDKAPKDTNGVTIKPFASIRWRDSSTAEPYRVGGQYGFIEVYVYQAVGYDIIEPALTRIMALINTQYLIADDRAIAYFKQNTISKLLFLDLDVFSDPCFTIFPSDFVHSNYFFASVCWISLDIWRSLSPASDCCSLSTLIFPTDSVRF